jgi:organic radical activating enzyme
MNIQTISIVVPTNGCVNKCPFCVSRMHDGTYENNWNENQMTKRIRYATMNNVNTCIITGTGEPLQNKSFLNKLSILFRKMDNPFPNIEFQTTGVFLSETEKDFDNFAYTEKDKLIYKNIRLLQILGVNTVSLSVADIFDDDNNTKLMCVPENLKFSLPELIKILKKHKFNIRLSLNMTKIYSHKSVTDTINRARDLGAEQITFRKLYYPEYNEFTEQGHWVQQNSIENDYFGRLNDTIKTFGKPLYRLPFGPMVYSIYGMSTVIDDDCMSKDNYDALKYIILREDGKLYTQWDDKGSIIF